MMATLFRFRDRERSRGQALVEFAVSIPIFMLVVLGIAEGGYYIAASTAVNSATHEGARLGVLETTASRSSIRNRVKTHASPIFTITSSDIDLQLAKVKGDGSYESAIACDNTCYQGRVKDDLLIVNTTYQHTPLVGYVFPGVTIPSNASAELIVEGNP